MASPVAMARGDNRKTTEKYESCSSGLYRPGVTTRWKLRYDRRTCAAPGRTDQEVGISRRHSGVAESMTTYRIPVNSHAASVRKCQCRPSPRLLRPGSAIHDENEVSSSRDVQSACSGSRFRVSRSHSLPGVQSS